MAEIYDLNKYREKLNKKYDSKSRQAIADSNLPSPGDGNNNQYILDVLQMETDIIIEELVLRNKELDHYFPEIPTEYFLAELYGRYQAIEYILHEAIQNMEK